MTWSSSPAPRRRSGGGSASWRLADPAVDAGDRARPAGARLARRRGSRATPSTSPPPTSSRSSRAPPRRPPGAVPPVPTPPTASRSATARSPAGCSTPPPRSAREHVVLLSSATVYGAWANNPVPLTEDAPLRPNPGVPLASEKAELERSAAEWRDAHPSATVALLRPTVTVAAERQRLAGQGPRLASRSLAGHRRGPARAVPRRRRPRHRRRPRPAGPARRAAQRRPRRLDQRRHRPRRSRAGRPGSGCPERLAVRLAGLRWRWGLAPTPPALLPFTVHPWVVANDRLQADGWEPASSNEEAYVGAHRAGPWATLSPRRRQELALGAAGVALVGVTAGAVALLRRRSPPLSAALLRASSDRRPARVGSPCGRRASDPRRAPPAPGPAGPRASGGRPAGRPT